MTLYRSAMAKAAAWTAASVAELPFPAEIIKEAIRSWAEDLRAKGELDENAVAVLSLCYRTLARFLEEEEADWAVPAFRKYRNLAADEIIADPESKDDLPRLEAISEKIIADAKVLEDEFRAFIGQEP